MASDFSGETCRATSPSNSNNPALAPGGVRMSFEDQVVMGLSAGGMTVFVLRYSWLAHRGAADDTLVHIQRALRASLGAWSGAGMVFLLWRGSSVDLSEAGILLALSLMVTLLGDWLILNGLIGPLQTSVRLRLLDEFYDAWPQALRQEDLRQRYSPVQIIDVRLKRLEKAGLLQVRQGRVVLKRKPVVFLVLGTISRGLHWLLRLEKPPSSEKNARVSLS